MYIKLFLLNKTFYNNIVQSNCPKLQEFIRKLWKERASYLGISYEYF